MLLSIESCNQDVGVSGHVRKFEKPDLLTHLQNFNTYDLLARIFHDDNISQ